MLKTIHLMLRNHDIVYLQETRLTSQDQINSLKTYFEGCHLFGSVSGASPAQAGALIIIKNTVTRHYDIVDAYSSVTPTGQGRIVSVKLVPKDEHCTSLFSFRETCIYLKSGSGKGNASASPQEERKAVVDELCTIPNDTHISFLGGDTNQHDNKIIEPFLHYTQMEEVTQDVNTFYRMDKHRVSSTRIDRWYCNISAAQASVVTPTCKVISTLPGTVGYYSGGKLENINYIPPSDTDNASHITDHIPLGLYLPPPGRRGQCEQPHLYS